MEVEAVPYVYLIFTIILIIAVPAYFFHSIRSGQLPANTQLLIDAWNSASENENSEIMHQQVCNKQPETVNNSKNPIHQSTFGGIQAS